MKRLWLNLTSLCFNDCWHNLAASEVYGIDMFNQVLGLML